MDLDGVIFCVGDFFSIFFGEGFIFLVGFGVGVLREGDVLVTFCFVSFFFILGIFFRIECL